MTFTRCGITVTSQPLLTNPDYTHRPAPRGRPVRRRVLNTRRRADDRDDAARSPPEYGGASSVSAHVSGGVRRSEPVSLDETCYHDAMS